MLFVFCNGECFEYPEKMQERLDAALETPDEAGDYFDHWEWLLAQCGDGDVILEQTTDDVGCGSLRFRVWIGIRRKTKDSDSRCHLVRTSFKTEFPSQDRDKYFNPTPVFVRWIKSQFNGKPIYDVGAGVGHVSKALSKAGLDVTALDLEPRSDAAFEVVRADGTEYQFEKGSVVMFCRPSHSGFVEKTIAKAIQSRVAAILYVGLCKNFKSDVGSIQDRLGRFPVTLYYEQWIRLSTRRRNCGSSLIRIKGS